MKKIAILIPTRERLDDLKIFAESWKNTTEGYSDVIIGIDFDDKSYDDFKLTYPEFTYEYGERKTSLEWLNYLAIKYSEKYEYIGFMEDDCNFNTQGWESIFINKLEELGDNGIVWGDDLINHSFIVGLPFMNSKIVKKLGYMCPPELKFLWCDYFWKHIGTALNSLWYFPDVIIEHRHYSTGKREKDNISVDADSSGESDCYFYNEIYLKSRFQNDVEKLRG